MLSTVHINVDRIAPAFAGVSARRWTDLGMTSTQPQPAT
jgi:hypothetical protein